MEPVGVLARFDSLKDSPGINMLRERCLHQDSVHFRIPVEVLYYLEEILSGEAFGRSQIKTTDPEVATRPDLVPDVNLGCRVLADQNHR